MRSGARVRSGGFLVSKKGEDRFQTLSCTVNGDQLSLALVADGHGGAEAADYVKENLLGLIAGAATDGSMAALDAAVREGVRKVHNAILAAAFSSSGSTVTLCAINSTRMEQAVWNLASKVGFDPLLLLSLLLLPLLLPLPLLTAPKPPLLPGCVAKWSTCLGCVTRRLACAMATPRPLQSLMRKGAACSATL